MPKEITSGNALGARYRIQARTGTVDSTETRAETEVTGDISGGGGYSAGGTGITNPVRGSVRSKTTRYQSIFLTDEDGVEHNIQLVDFLVPCKEGHKLTLLDIGGEYFRAYNHNTRQHCNHPKGVVSAMFPWLVVMIAMGVLALGLLFKLFTDNSVSFGEALIMSVIILAVAGAVLGAAGWIVAWVRSLAVRSNAELKSFVNGLGAA